MPISLRGTPTSSFRLGAGNVTNPSLSFVNNPSTGLFLTNGNIGISVNGTESMRITPSGLVVNGNVTAGTLFGDGSLLTSASFNTYVSNVQVANSTFVLLDDTSVDTAGGFVVVNGSGFVGGSMVLVGGTPATSTTVLSYTRLGAAVQPKASGTYAVTVVRPDSVSVNVPLGITYSPLPVWSTASNLGNVFWTESYTKSLAASSDSTVVYSNTAALPSSSTLASNGTLTGTVVDPTTTLYTFTIRATDTELQDSDRDFSINYINPFVPADAIYSLRKVNSSYTGNCVQVRRSSDNAVANIGFVSNALDTSSLLTFVGSGNDGFVSVWYDQSGFGRNVSQATAANQPGIVGNGVVVREGTSPALWFSGSSYLDGGDILDFGANSWATVTTAKVHNGTNEQMLWSKSSVAAGTGRYYLDSVPASLYSYGYTDDTVPTNVIVYHDPRDHSVYSLKYTRGTNLRFKVNSGIETVTTVTPTVTGNTSYPFRLGCYTNSDGTSPMLYLFGTIQEHVHYVSLVNDTYRAAMETNMTKVYKPIPITSVVATGGTVTTVGGYTIHAFTSSGNFVTSVNGQVEYLVVAGGGGGGGGTGAGGGGGGVIQGIISLTAGTYTVTIGGGGAGSGYVSIPYSPGTNGQNSVFGTLTAFGGGGGGTNAGGGNGGGVRGGSGGGSLGSTGQGLGIPGQGFAGGVTNFTTPYYGGGSGGGAGGPGVDGTSSAGGNGGPGMMSSISGAVAYYAGGGGGGTYAGGTLGSGGTGGGGAGGGFNGTANTGGGGGGQKDNSTTLAGTGGSGIVYLRYMLTPYIPSLIATGGTMSSAGAYTVHRFTTSGSFTISSNPANKTLEILVVAGGGGGGGGHAGGGGGGGGLISSSVSATNGSYTITVGGGGNAGTESAKGTNGASSSAFGSTAVGGGAGAVAGNGPGSTGGSGGGGSGDPNGTNRAAGSGTASQGYAGGSGNNTIFNTYGVGGGGGGAGQVGANATDSSGGNGGNGLSSSITGTSVYYAGGGGGGGWSGRIYGGIGGLGGGGYSVSGGAGLPGTANTGGGGAGSDVVASPRGGGAGGSGIVIIRYIA